VFTSHFRLRVKVYDLDLGEWLYNLKVQLWIFFSVLDWWLGTHLPKDVYIIGVG
jgi:hypothetical protein